MVVLRSLLLATGLSGLSQAAPTARAAGSFVPAIGYGTNPPDFFTSSAAGSYPEVVQLTPEEFGTWAGNASAVSSGPVPAVGSSLAEKRAVIGNDDRYYQASSDFPFGAIGRLYIPLGNGAYAWCSGTLVGPRLMAAARHCIVDGAQYFEFSPGYNNGNRFQTARVTKIVSLVKNDGLGNCDLKNDWALYVLDQPLGSQRGYFWVSNYADDESSVSNQPVLYNAGYPGDRDSGQHLYMSDSRRTSLSLKSSCANSGPITGDCDVAGGMSGGPLWVRVNDGRWTYGTLFGAFVDSNGNELSSIHAHGPQFVQGVNNLNAQNPA